MRGSSRSSLVASRSSLDKQLGNVDSSGASRLSADLFALVNVLNSSTSLRRALTDPSRSGEDKADLITDLISGQVEPEALAIASAAVSLRWSTPRDLVDAFEYLAVEAEAAAANLDGKLDDLEEELFRFGRILVENPALRRALVDQSIDRTDRVALLSSLVDAKVSASSARLIKVLVGAPRGRSIEQGLADFADIAAARRNRLVALVRSAIPLSAEQRSRLSAALTAQIGQPIRLNIEVDPSTIGGVVVRLGDEEVDGTIVSRLSNARRALAG
ncbi:MAG TPA: F0F1 ATP synthase subunit delta [Candidatus Nanopelagicaceae bacterium]|nr:F0F1 ATP synthase subunit delta [Candidatus Nanopelagicaceae bacterium]